MFHMSTGDMSTHKRCTLQAWCSYSVPSATTHDLSSVKLSHRQVHRIEAVNGAAQIGKFFNNLQILPSVYMDGSTYTVPGAG